MRVYGFVLAALALLILGSKVLQAGWNGNEPGQSNEVEQRQVDKESDHELALRWQQNQANHWRAFVMQHP
jgi:hypothetical protein